MDYTLSVQFFELVKLYFISYDGMKVFHIACVTDFVQKVFIWKCNQFIALNVATKVFICKCWILTIKQIKVDWCKLWCYIYYGVSCDPVTRTVSNLLPCLPCLNSYHSFLNRLTRVLILFYYGWLVFWWKLHCWEFHWTLKNQNVHLPHVLS